MSLFLDIFGYLSVILRGLILGSQSFTLGGLAFLLLLLRPLQPRLSAEAADLTARCRTVLRISAVCFGIFTLCSLALNAAALVGTLELTWTEALGAPFARADLVIAACAFLIGLLARTSRRGTAVALLSLAAVALAAQLSLTHAAGRLELRWPYLVSGGLHMLGAAIWIGGLPCFLIALNRCRDPADWRLIGRRYSLMSMGAVTALLVGGVVLAIGYLGSFEAIYGTAYGVMVFAKICLLLMLLGLGAFNFFTVDRLRRDPATPILRLKRFAEVEIGIGLTVIFAAASLTSLPPGIDLTQDRVSWTEIVERFTPQMPRLTSPDYDTLTVAALQAKITAADAQRSSAPQVYVPGEGTILPRNAADIAWSEFNHHWAGIFVLLIGLLALIEHFRWGRWARHWPLLFLLMAAFLFFRADEAAWPLGQFGFFESLRDPEIAQHRVFVLLIILFGLFEWRVRIGGLKDSKAARVPRIRSSCNIAALSDTNFGCIRGTRKSMMRVPLLDLKFPRRACGKWCGNFRSAALVFPLTTAIGGALLLTHSHAIANIRDQLLIEMSHTPLALCGITAGWARWLELRLDGRASRIASWIWPIAFVLVGLILLDYREA